MSTPWFLLAALPLGALLFAAGWAIDRLLDPLFGFEARLARLHRRRERRLARGGDRYFEELRSIDASLAQVSVQAARPRQNWLARPLALLLPFLLLALGVFALAVLLRLFGLGPPPAWIDFAQPAILLLLGLRYLVDPATAYVENAGRGIGFTFIGLSAVLFVLKLI